VFNTLMIYIVGAWVVLQVTELALPALDIPDRAIRYVWIGAFLLFPLVLAFGWRYDISTGGIRRTAPADVIEPDTAIKRSDHWVIGGLTSVALVIIASMLLEISRVAPEQAVSFTPQENSIFVMPFGVCEDRISDLPLAGGLTGSVISRLAQRDRLKVTGRTTTFNVAGIATSTQQLSQLLGTEYVLHGTLCRTGLSLTLDAQLRDKDGFIKWSEKFTEVTNRYDQVEQRLASLVSNGVALELGDITGEVSAEPVMRQALEQFLIGQEYRRQGDREKAHAAFEKALEYQPDFAEATWELALLEMGSGGFFKQGSAIERAWPLGERALELAMDEIDHGIPDSNAHRVAGRILFNLARMEENLIWRDAPELSEDQIEERKAAAKVRFSEAEQHFRSAIALNPSDGDLRGWLAWIMNHQGADRGAEALEVLQQSLELDPFNVENAKDLANLLTARGQNRQAMEVLDRFNALPVEKRRPLYWTRLEILNNLDLYDEKLTTLIELMETDPLGFADPKSGLIAHLWWEVSEIVHLGLDEEAKELYQQVEQIPYPEKEAYDRELFLVEFYLQATNKDEAAALRMEKISGKTDEEILDSWGPEVGITIWAMWQAGEKDRAIRLQEAFQHFQHDPRWIERQAVQAMNLAARYLAVGREDEGLALLADVVVFLEKQVDVGIRHPKTLETLFVTHALLKNDEAALETLDLAVDYGSWRLLDEIQSKEEHSDSDSDLLDWEERLMGNPAFVRSLNRMRSIRDQQAANVRNLLTQYDMGELLIPVIAAAEARLEQAD
jgi:TolB-like protein